MSTSSKGTIDWSHLDYQSRIEYQNKLIHDLRLRIDQLEEENRGIRSKPREYKDKIHEAVHNHLDD